MINRKRIFAIDLKSQISDPDAIEIEIKILILNNQTPRILEISFPTSTTTTTRTNYEVLKEIIDNR